MPGSFFVPVGDGRWLATPATGSPWDRRLMHAGPPSALLARAVESFATDRDPSAALTRLSVDILGPLHLGEVKVEVRELRPGRSVRLLEAVMSGSDRPLLRATVWVASPPDPSSTPPAAGDVGVPPRPDTAFDPWLFPGDSSGYVANMDMHVVQGDPVAPGPAAVWMRQRVPLVPDEEPSGVQRAMAVADSGNGISGVLDAMRYLYVNTDLTVHLHREPQGEWIYMSAQTVIGPAGVGVASSIIGDETGAVGRGAQSLYVAARAPLTA